MIGRHFSTDQVRLICQFIPGSSRTAALTNAGERSFQIKRKEPSCANRADPPQSGEHGGVVFTLRFSTNGQVVCTVYAQADDEADGHTDSGRKSTQANGTDMQVEATVTQQRMDPETICEDVERALCHLHNPAQLAKNPLVQLLDLEQWTPPVEGHLHSPGRALKQLLNEVVTTISGVDAGQKLTPSQWRLDHYLHLRYRVGIQHKDLAARLGYTERHLSRLRREHLLEAAELILCQCS